MPSDLKEFWQPPTVAPLDRQLASRHARAHRRQGQAAGIAGADRRSCRTAGHDLAPDAPRGDKAVLLVFAADHGLTEEGVSQYPSAVTVAMVMTYLAGRASANAFAAASNVTICVVDAGVAADLPAHANLIAAKIRMGTANAAREPAMTPQQASEALARGMRHRDRPNSTTAPTSSRSAKWESATPRPRRCWCIAWRRRRLRIASASAPVRTTPAWPASARRSKRPRRAATPPRRFEVLREFGGLEIAMMAGAVLGTASQRRPVLIDGFISSAAALVAIRLCPAARDYCIFAHRSAEKGHDVMLAALHAKPLLDLGLRLGEGTGAVLAVPLVRAAARLLTDVADLSDVLAGKI